MGAQMITTGVQDQQFAQKIYDPSTDSTRMELVPVKEKFIHLTLPVRRTSYCIKTDKPVRTWAKFGIWWHKHPQARCWFVRLGRIS